MVRITVRRTDGTVETVERADMSSAYATDKAMRERIIKANADAAKADPSKGGTVLAIEWVEAVKDTETVAWERYETAHAAWLVAEDAKDRDNGTGQAYRRAADAEAAMRQARADYVAAHGEDGKHLAASRQAAAAEKARREAEYRRSFVGRGLD